MLWKQWSPFSWRSYFSERKLKKKKPLKTCGDFPEGHVSIGGCQGMAWSSVQRWCWNRAALWDYFRTLAPSCGGRVGCGRGFESLMKFSSSACQTGWAGRWVACPRDAAVPFCLQIKELCLVLWSPEPRQEFGSWCGFSPSLRFLARWSFAWCGRVCFGGSHLFPQWEHTGELPDTEEPTEGAARRRRVSSTHFTWS